MSPQKKNFSRREILKKGIMASGGLVCGVYSFGRYFSGEFPVSSSTGIANGKLPQTAKEAMFYTRSPEGLKCNLCPHFCDLDNGERGLCRTRVNLENTLYTLAYSNPCALHNDPVEKKPLAHFLPSTFALSVACAGCNLRCKSCQNWRISQFPPEDIRTFELTPKDLVLAATNAGSKSIAYTYTEPSIFYEYMLDTSRQARSRGIKNIWVTAGYINDKPLRDLCKYLDAANIDLKGFSDSFYRSFSRGKLAPVLRAIKILRDENVWFEVTNLIIPTLNDNEHQYRKMAAWLYRNIGPDYPVHISRFHPSYKLTHLPPTPLETLFRLRVVAIEEGLRFVYIGNIPDHLNPGKNTYCPYDESLCIERHGYSTKLIGMNPDGTCKKCGRKIPGVFEP